MGAGGSRGVTPPRILFSYLKNPRKMITWPPPNIRNVYDPPPKIWAVGPEEKNLWGVKRLLRQKKNFTAYFMNPPWHFFGAHLWLRWISLRFNKNPPTLACLIEEPVIEKRVEKIVLQQFHIAHSIGLCKTYLVWKFEVSSFKNGWVTSNLLNEGRMRKIGTAIKNNPINRVVLDGRPDFQRSAFI